MGPTIVSWGIIHTHPTAQQAVLGWMVQSPSPIRQEVVNQLLGPVQYPILRRSLRRLRSTRELDGFLRPVLVPDNHARGRCGGAVCVSDAAVWVWAVGPIKP